MKKLILVLICCIGYSVTDAQPRIRQRDVIGLTDSIAKKVNRTDYRLTNARPASDVPGWAKSIVKPSYSPTEVGAAPAVHTQSQSTITALPDSLRNHYTKAQSDRRYAPYGSTGGGEGGVATDTTSLSRRIDQKVDLTDPRLTNARPASDVYPWAKQAVKPTYNSSEVGAAAATHSQAQTTITGLRDTLLNRYTKAQTDSKLSGKVNTTDPRLSDARPSTDVYPWAKQAVKPAYTATEVGAAAASHSQTQGSVIALPDSLLSKYTRSQTDRRYWNKASETEEATLYFYTKAQMDHLLDSVHQSLIDYIGANPKPTSTTLGNGLISVWEFDETSGTTATDAKGGHNATLYNGAQVNQTGKLGRCITYDGVNDYARVNAHVTAYDTLKAAFSISAWVKNVVKPAVVATGVVFKSYNAEPTTDAQWAIMVDPSSSTSGVNARMVCDELEPSYVYSNTENKLMPNDWHHLVITYGRDDHTMRIYMDGVLSGTRLTTGTITDSDSYLTFGSAGGMNYFNCSIDQTAIWNRELNLAEIQSIYNQGNGKLYTSW